MKKYERERDDSMAALWWGDCLYHRIAVSFVCDSGKTVSPFPSKGRERENDLGWIMARLMWLRLKTARGKSSWYCVALTTSLSSMWESLRSPRCVMASMGLVVSGKGEKHLLIAETRRVLTKHCGAVNGQINQRPHWERNTWKVSGTIVLQTEYIIHSYAWEMSSTWE